MPGEELDFHHPLCLQERCPGKSTFSSLIGAILEKEFWLYHNDFLFQMSTILRLYLVLFINYHNFFFSEMIHVFNSFPPSFYALG